MKTARRLMDAAWALIGSVLLGWYCDDWRVATGLFCLTGAMVNAIREKAP